MKEKRKDVKKMKYEEPRLIKLNTDEGTGQCETGSGAPGCFVGNTAAQGCFSFGNTPGAFCDNGNSPPD
ncbi:MAG TPA: hypothetical protein ACFYD6_01020 [Candidatus Brocadiia bacterium]|nr:hypothetical protein [Candidatus Brocadiales bacterium]